MHLMGAASRQECFEQMLPRIAHLHCFPHITGSCVSDHIMVLPLPLPCKGQVGMSMCTEAALPNFLSLAGNVSMGRIAEVALPMPNLMPGCHLQLDVGIYANAQVLP